MYLLIYAWMRVRGEGRCEFKPLLEKSGSGGADYEEEEI